MTRKQTEVAVIGILIIALILYAGAGVVYAGMLTASADRTLNSVVSHQNSLNTSFDQINNEVSALGGSGTFDSHQAVTLVDRSATNTQMEVTAINQDDASLASVQTQLSGTRWLTLVGRSGMDREASKVDHARNALAAARTLAADGVQDLRFWHYLYTAIGELDMLDNQASAGDYNAAKSTLTLLQGDVDQAIAQSTAPGLPADLHSFTVDLKAFVSDYGNQLNAQIAGDDATVAQVQSAVDSDRARLATHDFDKIQGDINAFYKPLQDRFNGEMAAAIS